MDVEDDHPPEVGLEEARQPTLTDLVSLCRELNDRNALYLVIGGFAIRAAGYDRTTMDVDLLIATDLENEARVVAALATLPDQAILDMAPGEVEAYTVVRVGDEIVVDLMKSACGIDYAEASLEIDYHEINGVRIPFASPRLLWRMKVKTHREKDAADLFFLRRLLAAKGIPLPG
jgi:hypothetical protein